MAPCSTAASRRGDQSGGETVAVAERKLIFVRVDAESVDSKAGKSPADGVGSRSISVTPQFGMFVGKHAAEPPHAVPGRR